MYSGLIWCLFKLKAGYGGLVEGNEALQFHMVTVHLLEKCNVIQLSMSDDCFLLIGKYHNLGTIWNNHIFLKAF